MSRRVVRLALFAAGVMLLASPLSAQTPPPAESDPAVSTAPAGRMMGSKEDRILWIFPNYRTVDEERSIPRIPARYKLTIAVRDSFDPYAFPIAGAFAGLTWVQDRDPSWGRGTDRYGKLYFASFADQTMSNMMAEGAFPVLFRQDPRYFRLGRGGVLHRAGYALSRIFVTRSDDGGSEFNYSEFGGNAVMAATGNLYYPREDRTIANTSIRFGTQVAFDAIAALSQEFWPDVKAWLTGR